MAHAWLYMACIVRQTSRVAFGSFWDSVHSLFNSNIVFRMRPHQKSWTYYNFKNNLKSCFSEAYLQAFNCGIRHQHIFLLNFFSLIKLYVYFFRYTTDGGDRERLEQGTIHGDAVFSGKRCSLQDFRHLFRQYTISSRYQRQTRQSRKRIMMTSCRHSKQSSSCN